MHTRLRDVALSDTLAIMEKKDGGDQGKPQAPVPGVDSVAGLSAGIVSTLIVHPLDLIKTRLQGEYS